mmetsp:Transcript_15331/g.33142  ORF Transcript_15331/g.33142 Transcript_15331/m.33142 type:complete len:82 (-) Transcript_15331:174-419(-)
MLLCAEEAEMPSGEIEAGQMQRRHRQVAVVITIAVEALPREEEEEGVTALCIDAREGARRNGGGSRRHHSTRSKLLEERMR